MKHVKEIQLNEGLKKVKYKDYTKILQKHLPFPHNILYYENETNQGYGVRIILEYNELSNFQVEALDKYFTNFLWKIKHNKHSLRFEVDVDDKEFFSNLDHEVQTKKYNL